MLRSAASMAMVLASVATLADTLESYPSTYSPSPAPPVLIRGATILDGRGGQIEGGDVLLREGKIAAVGANLVVPPQAEVVEARGKWLTPGIIDVHSHLGAGPSPDVHGHNGVNEPTGTVTARVRIEHGIWPQDPGFFRAMAAGVTTLQVLPGSGNLFGGRSVVLKNVPARTVQGMKFPGAPYGFKMACGEVPMYSYNPAQHAYGTVGVTPVTRMGSFAVYRQKWSDAQRYGEQWRRYRAAAARGDKNAEAPQRDLDLETLAEILSGEIAVHMHCHRADEMALILDLAREFGYRIAAFHHAQEAYKIPDLLANAGVCAAMWADWFGYNMESNDGIPENVAMVHAAGGCALLHSDSEIGGQHLNQEAGKALADGRRMGLALTAGHAWTWLSYNPAKALGIEDRTGSLEPGKMADAVLWSSDPLSVYALAEKVFVDGHLVFDRLDQARRPVSDFELGQVGAGDRK
jgi:imidazolonepropionase-like amidohydrolase